MSINFIPWLIIGTLLIFCLTLLYLYLQSISRLKEKVERDEKEQLFLDAIINDTVDSIYLKDTQNRIIFTNQTMFHNIGKKPDEVYGFTDKEIFDENVAVTTMAQEAQVMQTGIPLVSAVEVRHVEEGVNNNVLTTKVPVHQNGEVVGVLGITREYTDFDQEREALTHSATYDSLTDVMNRNAILSTVRDALVTNQPIAILFVDIDNFKQINDHFGHKIGDEVLIKFAQLMKSALRKNDRVGRYGGDEFTIMLSGITEHAEAETVVKNLLKKVQQPIKVEKQTSSCQVSIGIACSFDCPSPERKSAEHLIHCADQAMYEIKKNGKNDYAFYSNNSHEYEVSAQEKM